MMNNPYSTTEAIQEARLEDGVKGWEAKSANNSLLGRIRVNWYHYTA